MNLPKLISISDSVLKRPTILLLADDINAPSGIGTMAREFVFNTADRFNWVQIASTVDHPDKGKILDISKIVEEETGYEDVSVRLYPYSGYGDSSILRYILNNEKIDGILHFTDPRYWTWLYAMEYEIRSTYKIPIMYYSIWDDLPYPHWNLSAYSSCDLLMAINKQTHIIHKKVLEHGGYKSIDLLDEPAPAEKDSNTSLVTYVPHGIDSKKYRPLTESDPEWNEYQDFKNVFRKKHSTADFVIFWNNRNIRRKQPGDVILAFKMFCDTLPPEEAKKCALMLHTHPRDPNGTDLIAVKENICPDYQVIFSIERVPSKVLNFYYNNADVVLNIASNEGFGLSSAEAIMSGTPIISNVTGGLQDQLGFTFDDGTEYFPDEELTTNHTGKLRNHGPWAYPIYPSNRSLQGSLETPYIFDDRAKLEDIVEGMQHWFNKSRAERDEVGLVGRNWLINTAGMESKIMSNKIAESIMVCLKSFVPKPKVEIKKIQPRKKVTHIGIV